MRHLWSLLAGVVVAPLTWALVAAGQSGSSHTISRWVENDSYAWGNLLGPAVYLAVAGLLLGLIGTLRVSPFGPIVAGLLLIAPYAGLFTAPFAVRDAVPENVRFRGVELPLRLPLENGTLLLLGALLLMATFSIQRWRRWPDPDAPIIEPASTDRRALGDWPPAEAKTESDLPPLPRRDPDESSWPTKTQAMASRDSI